MSEIVDQQKEAKKAAKKERRAAKGAGYIRSFAERGRITADERIVVEAILRDIRGAVKSPKKFSQYFTALRETPLLCQQVESELRSQGLFPSHMTLDQLLHQAINAIDRQSQQQKKQLKQRALELRRTKIKRQLKGATASATGAGFGRKT